MIVDAVETRTKEELRKIFPFNEGDVIEMNPKYVPWMKKPYRLVVHYKEDGSGNFATFDLDKDAWRLVKEKE